MKTPWNPIETIWEPYETPGLEVKSVRPTNFFRPRDFARATDMASTRGHALKYLVKVPKTYGMGPRVERRRSETPNISVAEFYGLWMFNGRYNEIVHGDYFMVYKPTWVVFF